MATRTVRPHSATRNAQAGDEIEFDVHSKPRFCFRKTSHTAVRCAIGTKLRVSRDRCHDNVIPDGFLQDDVVFVVWGMDPKGVPIVSLSVGGTNERLPLELMLRSPATIAVDFVPL